MQTDLDVVQNGHIRKQTDILEGSGNAQLVDLVYRHSLDVDAVDQHGAAGGLIDAGEQIENGGLARAVGADQAGNFGGADGNVEAVHSRQAAEVDAQVPHVQNGLLALILLTDEGHGGNFQDFLGIVIHCFPPPSS